MSVKTLAQPDITLYLDIDGVIQSVALCNAISGEAITGWQGRPWIETVEKVGSEKVQRMLDDARTTGVSAFRQINQRFPSGLELPMEFTAVRLGGKEGLVAVGHSLQAVAELQSRLIAAQQAMEQDYWKLREVETRYRLLFDVSNEAVLLARVDNLQVIDANPAAIRGLGFGRGRDLLAEMAPAERAPFQAMLQRVREQGRAPGTLLHLGTERKAWTVRASLMSSEPGPVFLLQIVPVGASSLEPQQDDLPSVEKLIDRLPDGFVVVDKEGVVQQANQGFLDFAQIGAEGAAIGERLGRWLSQPGADMAVLIANLQQYGVVRRFSTTIHGELGTQTPVEISAAKSTDSGHKFVGILLREVGRRMTASPGALSLSAALADIVGQIGTIALPKLIKDTVGIVERHCIEAALEQTDGNRTAAAERLGLSRQSLYEKLNRYEMDGGPKTAMEILN
jgi:transcriptional regulator PpsR